MADDLNLTDTQRKVLDALCRPCTGGSRFAPPATNQEIADELFLSVDAIKAHLRVLFRKFGIEDLPHNQKRARLVELAFERGVVSEAPGTAGEEPVPAGRAEEPERPAPSAKPKVVAERAGGARRGAPWRLFAAGAVGAAAVVALAVILFTGGDGDSGQPTHVVFVRGMRSACVSAVKGADVAPGEATPSSDSLLSAILNVRSAVEDLGTPSGSSDGLPSFVSGLDRASTALRNITNETVTDGATTFGSLTVASGLIQVGTSKLRLGPACRQLSAWVGATQPPIP